MGGSQEERGPAVRRSRRRAGGCRQELGGADEMRIMRSPAGGRLTIWKTGSFPWRLALAAARVPTDKGQIIGTF